MFVEELTTLRDAHGSTSFSRTASQHLVSRVFGWQGDSFVSASVAIENDSSMSLERECITEVASVIGGLEILRQRGLLDEIGKM